MNDMLPLKQNITYGPVNSRRLGRSLGINLLPSQFKWCTFDCLYCQYGWTPKPASGRKPTWTLPTVGMVVSAVESALDALPEPPEYLTFSGNGEPTLHSDFSALAEAVSLLRNRRAPRAKIALLSNSSRLVDPAVRGALAYIDRPIFKLDAGNENFFRSYNRPLPGTNYNDILAGLIHAGPITLQTLFTEGTQGNLSVENISCWIETVKKIDPLEVQLYTLSRPFPSRDIMPASRESLLSICLRVKKLGIPACVF